MGGDGLLLFVGVVAFGGRRVERGCLADVTAEGLRFLGWVGQSGL